MKSERSLARSTASRFFRLISKRRMAINVLWNFLKNMVCTARITAAAFFPKMSGTGGTVRSEVC